MTFTKAVETAPAPVNAAYKKGKQALKRAHREKVECRDTRRFTGSIDLDSQLNDAPGHENTNRWDYGIGYKPALSAAEDAVWIEIHPASTRNVNEVLSKLTWLKDYLANDAVELGKITGNVDSVRPFHWLATGSGTHVNKNSPQARQLRAAGLDLPRQQLVLP